MHIDSRPVSSNQLRPHEKLPQLVRRHLGQKHRKPVAMSCGFIGVMGKPGWPIPEAIAK